MTKRLWVIGGFLSAAALGAVPLVAAQAYPPENKLSVEATPLPDPTSSTKYTVTVKNGKPGCTVVLSSRGTTQQGTIDSLGNFTTTFDIGTKTGNHVITARTTGCGSNETSNTNVKITKNQARGPASVTSGTKVTLSALGWSPDDPVVFTLTNGKGKKISSPNLTPNEDGDVDYVLTAPDAGTWAVVITQKGAASQSFTLTVKASKNPQSKPTKPPKKKPTKPTKPPKHHKPTKPAKPKPTKPKSTKPKSH
ncbi:MAG TPA: hypothetical protein VE781_08040 [Kineosporiaceae bacterium]|jgi:hypothetical protein|nr:hypothetical protein [Kineosporiaceae bacterium]